MVAVILSMRVAACDFILGKGSTVICCKISVACLYLLAKTYQMVPWFDGIRRIWCFRKL